MTACEVDVAWGLEQWKVFVVLWVRVPVLVLGCFKKDFVKMSIPNLDISPKPEAKNGFDFQARLSHIFKQ